MQSLSHSDVIAMMEPMGTVWVQEHAQGIDVEISCGTDRRDPCVYAWVVDREIIYLGKAGQGLARRMREHERGMKPKGGSTRGQSHAAYLAQLTEQHRTVMLYALWPEPVMFREHSIASHSSVEDWLIAALEPTPVRNREAKTA